MYLLHRIGFLNHTYFQYCYIVYFNMGSALSNEIDKQPFIKQQQEVNNHKDYYRENYCLIQFQQRNNSEKQYSGTGFIYKESTQYDCFYVLSCLHNIFKREEEDKKFKLVDKYQNFRILIGNLQYENHEIQPLYCNNIQLRLSLLDVCAFKVYQKKIKHKFKPVQLSITFRPDKDLLVYGFTSVDGRQLKQINGTQGRGSIKSQQVGRLNLYSGSSQSIQSIQYDKKMKTYRGWSGSPIFNNGKVVGIHLYGDLNTSSGLKLDQDVLSFLNEPQKYCLYQLKELSGPSYSPFQEEFVYEQITSYEMHTNQVKEIIKQLASSKIQQHRLKIQRIKLNNLIIDDWILHQIVSFPNLVHLSLVKNHFAVEGICLMFEKFLNLQYLYLQESEGFTISGLCNNLHINILLAQKKYCKGLKQLNLNKTCYSVSSILGAKNLEIDEVDDNIFILVDAFPQMQTLYAGYLAYSNGRRVHLKTCCTNTSTRLIQKHSKMENQIIILNQRVQKTMSQSLMEHRRQQNPKQIKQLYEQLAKNMELQMQLYQDLGYMAQINEKILKRQQLICKQTAFVLRQKQIALEIQIDKYNRLLENARKWWIDYMKKCDKNDKYTRKQNICYERNSCIK